MPTIKQLFSIATLFVIAAVFSQNLLAQQFATLGYKTTTVFFNPLNVLEPDIPVAITFEQRLSKRYAVAIDVGTYITSNYGLPAGGFRLKPEFKFYFPEHYRASNTSATYFSFQALVKHVSFGETEEVGRQCNNGQCAYFQKIDYKVVKDVYGGNIIFGKESFLGEKQHFYIGMYIGFGFRYKHFYDKDLPSDVVPNDYNTTNGFGLTVTKNGWYPSVPMGVNIGWRIK